MNKKVLFSTLWIFVTLNYIFCDVFTLFHSESLKQLMTGEMGGMEINQQFLNALSFLMELANVLNFLYDYFLGHICTMYFDKSIDQGIFISDLNILIRELTKQQ